MGSRRLLLIALAFGCHGSPSAAPSAAETVELPPALPLAVDEGPVVYPTFDAGGATVVEIPTVACDDISALGTTKISPPPKWKMKATKELLALDNPPSQLRVYMSPFEILLGPPGFGCRSMMFSSGYSLAILPVDEVSKETFGDSPLDGELVRTEGFSWLTSGYWVAGSLASRIFPEALHDRLQLFFAVRGWGPRTYFPTGPFPGELVTVDGLHASYVDPPGVAGIAAEERNLKPNGDPIQGSLFEVGDTVRGLDAMQVLAVRLRAERDPLTAAIIADFDARMRDDRDDPAFQALPRCTVGEMLEGPHCPP